MAAEYGAASVHISGPSPPFGEGVRGLALSTENLQRFISVDKKRSELLHLLVGLDLIQVLVGLLGVYVVQI